MAKKRGRLMRRARRDVMLSIRPYLQELGLEREQAITDTGQLQGQVQAAYEALGKQLSALGTQYGPEAEAIRAQFQADLGALGTNMGSISPAGELAAATTGFGTIGAGGLGELASNQMRNVAYNTSAQRQGDIEQMTTARNYEQDLNQYLQDLAARRRGIMGQVQPQILSQLDALRDQQWQRRMAQQQLELQRKSMEAIAAFLGQQAAWHGPNNGNGNDGGKPNSPARGSEWRTRGSGTEPPPDDKGKWWLK